MANEIYVKGANENNLKHVDVKIPRDQLVVLTGLSGSGKSSLAFDTIYAEGQRRYAVSYTHLDVYKRQIYQMSVKQKFMISLLLRLKSLRHSMTNTM